jgi:YfiH family protein
VHGDRVLRADETTAHADRLPADAMVTDAVGVALAVHSGDCPTVGFVHESGAIGVAHGGWKGLEAGVLESTVRALRRHDRTGARSIHAAVGPHIRAARYEFGAADLDRLARRFGERVISHTEAGRPSLDLTAAIAIELDRLGADVVAWAPECTSVDARHFWSHRARGESGRVALVAWIEST